MRRRQLLSGATTLAFLTGCGLLPGLGKSAAARMPRIGFLNAANSALSDEFVADFKRSMADLGYMEGGTIAYVRRAGDNSTQYLALARELVQLPVDVLVVGGNDGLTAARQATADIPIVFSLVPDPVGQGFVSSLAHPGENVTGVTYAAASTLKLQATTPAADALSIQLKTLPVNTPDDIDPALAEALGWPAQVVLVYTGSGAIIDAVSRFVDFQTQNHLPVVFDNVPTGTTRGGLMSYSGSQIEQGRSAASLVDRILKGANPADLPVEQPTVYDLVINQTVAQALGISIPPDVTQEVTQWDT
jgi:putative ABC transport system substrate-binding protein